MGVPKFYRWISERYPCLSSFVKEEEIPVFDNFYLDMNGIIHHCSHPNDADVNFRITEEEIYKAVFNYVEVLFSFIRPQKILYLAIDGVAPRAKMNQQRGRRFRTAKEAREQELQAKREGKKLSEEARFDSNAITPGTDFMERLDLHLRYFIAKKISEDATWRNVDVHYSSHLVPGEGEHKILEFIRFIRSQKDYDPNTRHCLYGLDADLIMLGLSVHEPFVSLLREEVKFGKSTQAVETKPEKITFHLLHLSIMRDYLNHEFEGLADEIKFKYDVEKIIDDWILMGFLVGNDFIPHLPGLHINKSAFDEIYSAYKKVLPSLQGYINESGFLNLHRFQALLSELEKFDLNKVEDELDDVGWMESKRGGNIADGLNGLSLWDPVGEEEFDFDKENGENGVDESDESSEEESAEDITKAKVFAHKEKYYKDKMRMMVVDDNTLSDLACEYVRAIQWNLHYYYHGVPSWGWFYPYNYAPYISDLKNFAMLKDDFKMGEPFKPFEQLMAVLPSRSKGALPKVFHSLFTPASPIYDFYPEDFATDLNGKANDWEAIVLIPFIEESRLVDAIKPRLSQLTPGEKRRNVLGPGFVFRYSPQRGQPYASPSRNLPAIEPFHAQLMHYDYKFHTLPRKAIRLGKHEALRGPMYSPGFPTLGFLKHTAQLKLGNVQVFQHKSRGPSVLLKVDVDPEMNYFEEGVKLLGKTVFVNWPLQSKAVVDCVTDGVQKCSLASVGPRRPGGPPQDRLFPHGQKETVTEPDDMDAFDSKIKELEMMLNCRKGIDCGRIQVLVYVRACLGNRISIRKDGRAAYLDPVSSTELTPYPMQMVSVDDRTQVQRTAELRIDQIFAEGARVFVLGFPYYGREARVHHFDRGQGFAEVVFDNPPEPYLDDIINEHYGRNKFASQYEAAGVAAKVLQMSPQIISRLTGTVFARVHPDDEEKVNIGLSLKATKANTEMRGYTKRSEQENARGDPIWLYSDRVLDLIHEYRQRFPHLFNFLLDTGCQDPSFEDIYPRKGAAMLAEVKAYLATLPTAKMTQQACGGEFVDEYVLDEIQKRVDQALKQKPRGPTRFRTQIHPRLLYRYMPYVDKVVPDSPVTWEMYDRVICVREGSLVPVGLRGTVVGITNGSAGTNVSLTVLYDKAFMMGGRMTKNVETPAYSFLNLTHGMRKQYQMEQSHGTNYFLRVYPVYQNR